MPDDERTDQERQNGEGAGAGETSPKLYAGKFKSIEDMERAYEESERQMHETRQENARWTEWAQQNLRDVGDDSEPDEFTRRHPRREERREPGIDSAKFFSNPEEVLREREQRIQQQVMRRMMLINDVGRTAERFMAKNPDLEAAQPIFVDFVRKQPGHLAVQDRLENAAKETRSWINNFKGRAGDETQPGRQPSGGEYVEGAASGGPTDRNNSRATPTRAPSEEEELNDYLNARRSQRAKMAGEG